MSVTPWAHLVLSKSMEWTSPFPTDSYISVQSASTLQSSGCRVKKIIEFLLFQLIILTCAEIRKKEYIKKLSDFQSGFLATSFY